METPEDVARLVAGFGSGQYDNSMSFDDFKVTAKLENGGFGWQCCLEIDNQRVYFRHFGHRESGKMNEEKAWRTAFDYFNLMLHHNGEINAYGICEETEKIKFDNGNKSNVEVRLFFSKILKLWFFSVTYNHSTGGGGSGIRIYPIESGCQHKDVAIFFALLEGKADLIGCGVKSFKKLDAEIKKQFAKILGFPCPEYYSKIKIPEFVY